MTVGGKKDVGYTQKIYGILLHKLLTGKAYIPVVTGSTCVCGSCEGQSTFISTHVGFYPNSTNQNISFPFSFLLDEIFLIDLVQYY